MKSIKLAVALFTLLTIVSCKKDDETEIQTDNDNPSFSMSGRTGIIVNNEGQFLSGNASLSFYDSDEVKMYNGIYQSINSSTMGDVLNSVYVAEENNFFVINNSGKIIKTDKSLNKTSEITGFTSPRFMLPISGTDALVTDLFSNEISIVDLNSETITGSITTAGWTEFILGYGNKTFAADRTNNKLLIIDNGSLMVVEELEINDGISGMAQAENGNLFILTQTPEGINTAVIYDVNTEQYTDTLELGNGFDWNTHPVITEIDGLEYLYYSVGGIQRILTDNTEDAEMLITTDTYSLYGMSVIGNEIIICDAKDYISSGEINIFDLDGNAVSSFEVGVAPNAVFSVEN